MKKTHDRKKRRLGGYTMAEVLIVIAILGILAALAIPSVITYRRDLKLTELDDNARTIYLAAQNNLSALRSAAGETLELGGATGRNAEDGVVVSGTQFKYVSTNVASAEPGWLVLPGSVDSALMEEGSYYLVEFDPVSGVVYGVFYTEKGDGKPFTEAVYHAISDPDKNCRVREGRDDFAKASGGFLLGYYGANGEVDLSRPDAQTLPKPKLKLTNAEELALDITAAADSGVDLSRVFYTVSISDGAHVKTIVEKGKYNDAATNTVVLDTLKSTYSKVPENAAYGGWTIGAPFAQWVQDSGIVPGADVAVTVTIWYDPASGEGLAALPQSASVTTNSLFAARDGSRVQVGYGRHLQNLGLAGLDTTVTAAVQTRDIDFAKTTPANDKDTRQHWAETYGDRKFTSIGNANLTGFNGQGRTIANLDATAMPYAGLFSSANGMTLEHIVMEDARVNGMGSAGALAGMAKDTTVTHCQVYLTAPYSTSPRIQSNGTAGGLIGLASGNVTIEGSFASTVVKGGTTGGLVGRGQGLTVRGSYAAGHLSGNQAGGLVGGLENITARATIQNSYAAGCIASATSEAAGLVVPHVGTTAESNQITIQNSYAAVDYGSVPTSDKVYGTVPVGSCTNVSYLAEQGVNDAVTPAGVTALNDSALMQARADLGLGAGFIDGGNAKTRPYNLVERTEEEGPLSAPYPYPTLRVSVNGEAANLPHYGDWLEAVAPPAPQSLIAYYEQFGGVTEYSAFVNGAEQGTLDLTRTGAINADGYAFLSKEKLHNDWEETVALTVSAVGMETRESTVQGRLLGALDEEFQTTADAAAIAYYVYAIPTTAIDVIPSSGCYNEVTVKGTAPQVQWGVPPVEVETTAWVNPLFGRAAYNGSKPGGDPGTIHIRSLRQLANIGRFFGDKRDYLQDLDIDASIYYGDLAFDKSGNSLAGESRVMNDAGHVTVAGFEVWGRGWDKSWDYVTNVWSMPAEYRLIVSPIGAHGTPGDAKTGYDTVSSFNATYDGNGRVIRALSIRSHYYAEDKVEHAGLFHRVRGTLKNIRLTDCDVVGATGTSTGSTGMLAARLSDGSVTDCTVTNCAVTAQGTKAGGHMGGLIGYLDNKGKVSGCAVENCVVAGGEYIRNVGGFVGNVYKLNAASAIRDCTVKNVQVSNGFNKGKTTDSIEKRGSVGGFVGCVYDSAGVVESCVVIGAGDLQVSGDTWNAGGFAGSVSTAAIQSCGVRLEGNVKKGYDAQRVTGGKYVGGFAGTIATGSVSASYAAVGVDGPTAGGFAGTFTGGSVSNCYAGGRTSSGKFNATSRNVTATDTVGGLIGLWSGGTLDTCYTTCAVSGAVEGKTDIFANTSIANADVTGCYALGEAFVNGAKYGKHTVTSVATKMPELAEDQRAETHPYDATLEDIAYPYAPAKDAAGQAVAHYGDWPYTVNRRPGFEWTPAPEEFEPADLSGLQSAEAHWTEEGLKLTIATVGSGTTLDNLFAKSGGNFSVSSDLGEVLNLQAVSTGGAGAVRITDSAGNVWEITPTVIATTPDGHPIRSYEFTIPAGSLPPYLETLGVGGFKQGDMIEKIKYQGTAEGFQPTEPFEPGDSVAIDGSFDDWTGYPHQVLAYTPGNGATAGTAIGAAFGDGNDIYLHIRNHYPPNLVPADQLPYTGGLTNLIITNLPMSVVGDDNWSSYEFPWWKFTNQNYTGPGIYKLIHEKGGMVGDQWVTESVCQVECYLEIHDDGSQEMEMLIHLEAIAGSQKAANKITSVTIRPALGGSLTIWREPPEEE